MNKNQTFPFFVANFIISKKYFILVLFTLSVLFSLSKLSETEIQSDLTSYLQEDSMTRVGLEVMTKHFGESTIVSFMIKFQDNLDEIKKILESNQDISIMSISDETDQYILFTLAFESEESAIEGKEFIENSFDNQEIYLSSTAYNSQEEYLAQEMKMVLIYAVIVIIVILLFTSGSFAEIPVLLLVFAIAAVLGVGTNYIFGEISYISNSVSVILQLALAIDYALIFVHRYEEERKEHLPELAGKYALSKAIPEVSASSFTTISGLVALSFMSYGIGYDMAMVLIKAILISLATVFLLLPSLIVMFDKAICSTSHRSFVPSIAKVVEISVKTRFISVPIFLVLTFFSFNYASNTAYTFSVNEIVVNGTMETQKIESIFGKSNSIAIMIPLEEETTEFLNELENIPVIETIISYDTLEIVEGVTLSSEVNQVEMSALLGLEEEMAGTLFGGYASSIDEIELFYADMNGYSIPILDLLEYLSVLAEQQQLPHDLTEKLDFQLLDLAYFESLLLSEEYRRILLNVNLNVEGEETYLFVEELSNLCDNYFTESHLVGESINSFELYKAFNLDKIIVNGFSVLFIAVILVLTLKSFTFAISMIFCIQAAINFNFAIPYLQNTELFFIGYLVVVAIQMGATIDYAIVISSRYKLLLKNLQPNQAIVQAVDKSFATIFSSGGVLSLSGLIMNQASTDAVISSLGECLARGTLFSMLIVIFILPSLLLLTTKKKSYPVMLVSH